MLLLCHQWPHEKALEAVLTAWWGPSLVLQQPSLPLHFLKRTHPTFSSKQVILASHNLEMHCGRAPIYLEPAMLRNLHVDMYDILYKIYRGILRAPHS